jgi:hypothetical protein
MTQQSGKSIFGPFLDPVLGEIRVSPPFLVQNLKIDENWPFSRKPILFQKIHTFSENRHQNMKMNNLSMSKTRRTLTLATFVCCECSMYKIKFGWDTFDNENLFCDETPMTMKIYFVMRHIRQMKFYFLMVSHPLSLFNFDFSSVIHHNEILQVYNFIFSWYLIHFSFF